MSDALFDFYDRCDDECLNDDEIIAAARAEGHDLAVVVGALLDYSTLHDQAPLRALVAVCGLHEARAVFARIDPAKLDDPDLDTLLQMNADAAQLRRVASDASVSLASTIAAITPSTPPSLRAYLIEQLVRRTTPGEAARFVVDVDDDVAAAVATGVFARVALLDAVPSMLSAGLSPAQLAPVIARFYDVVVDDTLSPELFAIDLHAAALAAVSRDVRAAIPTSSSSAWIAVLRRRGLKASAAVLHLLEQVPAPSLSAIAALLVDAGYGDELLQGFVENGCGTQRSLTTLAHNGWRIDTMVKALLAQGQLASEVRDHLLELKLSRAAVVDVLLRHVPADVVALVVP